MWCFLLASLRDATGGLPVASTLWPHSSLEGITNTMPMTPEEADTTVRALLKAGGLNLTEEQIAHFVSIYPTLREGADSLYIPEARYEVPALNYRAAIEPS